jgi:adenylate cyclase
MGWNETLQHALALEVLRSERLRITMVAGVLVFLIVLLLVLAGIPGLLEEALRRETKRVLPWVLPVMAAATIYELGMRRWIGGLLERDRPPNVTFQYVNAFIEVSIPSAYLLLAADVVGPVEVFSGAAPMVYFLFVFLTALQLNARLSLFAGLIAGAEFVALALWSLRTVPAIPDLAILTAPHQYVIRGLLLIIAGGVAGFVTNQIRQQFTSSLQALGERDRAISIFGQHVSPEVADKLLKQSFDVGGELRNVCVMFLDVRDFSRFASVHTPEEVMAYLNTLFSRLIDVVNQNHGIVNKFLGDGFMAVFGAPVDDTLRCQHALGASLEIISEVDRLNEEGTIPQTRIGIGLHMGEAVTGNVGSSVRKEYTVIGDVVNLASRIEQATKRLDGQLLISETVWKEVDKQRYHATDLGPVELKGQAEPIRVYQLA